MQVSRLAKKSLFSKNDFRFSIRNKTTSDIIWRPYIRGLTTTGEVVFYVGEALSIGGGGVLDGDSVYFIRKDTNDSLFYKNFLFGGDTLANDNFFYDLENWVHEGNNKYFWTVTDEDFE